MGYMHSIEAQLGELKRTDEEIRKVKFQESDGSSEVSARFRKETRNNDTKSERFSRKSSVKKVLFADSS